MTNGRSAGTPLVLHVLPRDMARGAQVFARALRDRLDGPDTRHRTLTLFGGPPAALDADHRLDIRPNALRRTGLDPRVLPHLRRAFRDLAPTVVVAHGGEPLKYCAAVRPPGTRLIYYKIGTAGRRDVDQGLRGRWHRRLLRSADTVVAISDALADELRASGLPDHRVAMIPNGRAPDPYHRVPRVDGPTRLIYVGQIEPPKRPLWFVEVVRRVVGAHPDAEATMVGTGPQSDEVRRAARDLPVEILGRRDDVPDLLARADVLVSPSAREGMPGVLIEAGLSHLPVVTTRVSGADTVVADGVTGHIVGVDDLDGLAARTVALAGDPRRRQAMGDAARRRCEQHFTLDVVADSWRRLLTIDSHT